MILKLPNPRLRLVLALLAVAMCLARRGYAQQEASSQDIELRYADGLKKLGLPEYAEIVLKRMGGGAGTEKAKFDLMLARGQHKEADAFIAGQANQDSPKVWELKLALADSLFAWGKYKESRSLYDAFFKKYPAPVEAMKEFYLNTAYKSAQMLLLINQLAAALQSYSNALKAADANVARQIKGEMAEVMLRQAQEEPDAAKREAILKQVEPMVAGLLWIQDLWFGKAIVMLAHIKMLRGNLDGAMKLIDDYKEQLLGIDEALKQEKEQGKEDLTRLSPMAQCRYLLAVIMQREAEKILASGQNKSKAYELLVGKHDKGKQIPGAIQHYLNVFIRYSTTQWAPDAGTRYRQVETILREQFGKKVDFAVPPDQWAVVERAQLTTAQMLFNESKFEEAADSYVKILNVFPDTETSVLALNNLCRCYVELGNEIYAEMVLRHLAERFCRREAILTKAGDAVLSLGDFYAEKQKPQMKAAVYDLFMKNFRNHGRTPGMLYRLAQERLEAGDLPQAQGYFQRIANDYSNSPAYFGALSGLANCYNKAGNTEAEIKTLNGLLDSLQKQSRPGHIYVNAKFRLASAFRRLDPKFLPNALNRYVEVIGLLTGDVAPYQNSAEEAKKNQQLLEAAMYQKGMCYAMLPAPEGKPETFYKEEAVKTLEGLLQAFPKTELAPSILTQIGTLWTILQKSEEAQRAFARLQKEYPNSMEAKNADFLRGMNLLKIGMRQQAIDVFKKMFSGEGSYRNDQIVAAGNELLKAGENQIAMEAFSKVLSSGSKDRALREPALYGQGAAQLGLGQFVEASKTLESLMTEYKNSGYTVEAALALSRSYCEIGSKEPDADKRYALFNSAVKWMKVVRRYSKEAGQKAESEVAVARIFVRQAEASERFGPKEMARDYRNDAIAAFQILIMSGDATDPKVAAHIETAYHDCIPLMLAVERWQDAMEDCERYVKIFERGKYLPDVGTWMNVARSKLATQATPRPAAP